MDRDREIHRVGDHFAEALGGAVTDIKGAASVLRVSTQTIRRAVGHQTLMPSRTGPHGAYIFTAYELARWVVDQREVRQ